MHALRLLRALTWPEWRHHAARQAVAVLAVALGVALAFSVQLINGSALSEFAGAVRSVQGEADLELRAVGAAGFDESLYARVGTLDAVRLAAPTVEVDTYALDANGERAPLRIQGIDVLVSPRLSPALLPKLEIKGEGASVLDPNAVFLNAAAQEALGVASGGSLRVQSGAAMRTLKVAGTVVASGMPMAVMDIAGAQSNFGRIGRLSRIDLRLRPGTDADALVTALQLPADVRAALPDDATQRVSQVSRAYRVNLTVLALVALFTGAFLVFSILSLSVAKRLPQFALLGVLGMDARTRLKLVMGESALVGVIGSVLGVALGTALAWLALRELGGDLGGGYFTGARARLQWSAGAAIAYALLGTLVALLGGWLPARTAQGIAPAQALKGLGTAHAKAPVAWPGLVVMAVGALLALLPPIADLPIAAYASVALLLLGGIACVPAVVGALLRSVHPGRSAPWTLALARARWQRSGATVAVAGVVASLSLAVALSVMVASFRDAVTQWLDTLLPADLYVRSAGTAQAAETAWLAPEFVAAAAKLPGVARCEPLRFTSLSIDPRRPAPVLIARTVGDPARTLPLVGRLAPARAGLASLYVSEAMQTLYGAQPGRPITLPFPEGRSTEFMVRGVWRDYARQQGAVVIDVADFVALTGDTRANDLAITLAPGASLGEVQAGVRALASDPALIEFATPGEIRAISLRIFDRSFAVTYWLQAVAIGIGLFGIAASFSAQALARRKEFGLLAHLGFTRAQVLGIVAGEGIAWSAAGAALGLALGIAVSVVLVKVVNPQSFHWTMDLLLPWARLALLCLAVMLAGTATATICARAAASRSAVLAVKEDW